MSVKPFYNSFIVLDHTLRLLQDGRLESALETITISLYSSSFRLAFLLGLPRLTDYSLEVLFKCFEIAKLLLCLCCDVLIGFGRSVASLFRTGALRIHAAFHLDFRVLFLLWFIDILMD